jgi:hypothetical protein
MSNAPSLTLSGGHCKRLSLDSVWMLLLLSERHSPTLSGQKPLLVLLHLPTRWDLPLLKSPLVLSEVMLVYQLLLLGRDGLAIPLLCAGSL